MTTGRAGRPAQGSRCRDAARPGEFPRPNGGCAGDPGVIEMAQMNTLEIAP